jgi:hypothetical protein
MEKNDIECIMCRNIISTTNSGCLGTKGCDCNGCTRTCQKCKLQKNINIFCKELKTKFQNRSCKHHFDHLKIV